MKTFFVGLAVVAVVSCSKGQPELTEADKAGEEFTEGSRVEAPLGKRKRQPATVVETYGKLAKLKFADHNVGWALLKDLHPEGAVTQFPKGDGCDAKVGDEVLARWSTSLSLTKATVDEVYGKLVHLQFVDKDIDWALCSDLKPIAEAEESEASSGDSAAVTKCKRGCNSSCHGAKNKSKCVAECRRACG